MSVKHGLTSVTSLFKQTSLAPKKTHILFKKTILSVVLLAFGFGYV